MTGKSRKKVAQQKKEEEQARKVVKTIFVALFIIALVMLIGYSFWS